MKDAITYANDAGFFSFNVIGWKAEFERLIDAVRADMVQGPVACEHKKQSVTHYSNETWIQHCELCGAVIKSGTYINETGVISNEVTTQQEPVAWLSGGGILTSEKWQAEEWIDYGGTATPLYTTPPTAALLIQGEEKCQQS